MPAKIREILETKSTRSGRLFLVDWVNKRKKNSWMNEEDIDPANVALVAEFMEAQNKSKKQKKTPAKKRSRSRSVNKASAKKGSTKKAKKAAASSKKKSTKKTPAKKASAKKTPAKRSRKGAATREVVSDKKQKIVKAPAPPLPASPEAEKKSKKKSTKKRTPASKRARVSTGKTKPATATKKSKRATAKKSTEVDEAQMVASVVYRSRLRSASVQRKNAPLPDTVRSRTRSRSRSPIRSPVKKASKKKASTKKAPAKKMSTKKAPSKKVSAKKASSKKAPVKASPEKKQLNKNKGGVQRKKRVNKAANKLKEGTKTHASAVDLPINDLELLAPILTTIFFAIVTVWAMLSVFTRSDSLSFDTLFADVPQEFREYIPVDALKTILLPSDVSVATGFLAITVPALLSALFVFHAYESYAVDNVGQFVGRMLTSDFFLFALFFIKPAVSNDQAWVDGIFTLALASTIVDVLVYSGGNTFPQNLQSLMHITFRGWLVLAEQKNATVVENCFLVTQYIIVSHGITATAIFARVIGAKFVSKLFSVASQAFMVIGLPYIAVNMFEASTVPAAIAVAYAITDSFLSVVQGYTSSQR